MIDSGEKQTVAVLLTRGPMPDCLRTAQPLKYKALLPVDGRPLADYVLTTLHRSDVEKVFIIQGEDEGLEKVVASSEKNVFVNCQEGGLSMAGSMYSGLLKAVEYYGEEDIHRRNIMIVPCDIPAATVEGFNFLIEESRKRKAHVFLPIISSRQLSNRYPGRSFRSIYLRDMDDRYTVQNTQIWSGSILKLGEKGEGNRRLSFSIMDDSTLDDMLQTLHRLYSQRRRFYQWPQILFEFVRLLSRKKRLYYGLKLVTDVYRKRLTMERFRESVYLISGLSCDFIESKCVGISGDIDKPEDLASVLGIDWEQVPAPVCRTA